MKFAIHHVEQIAHSDLVPGWKLHEGHSRWDVFVLRNPEGNDVITGGPGEISVEVEISFSSSLVTQQGQKTERVMYHFMSCML